MPRKSKDKIELTKEDVGKNSNSKAQKTTKASITKNIEKESLKTTSSKTSKAEKKPNKKSAKDKDLEEKNVKNISPKKEKKQKNSYNSKDSKKTATKTSSKKTKSTKATSKTEKTLDLSDISEDAVKSKSKSRKVSSKTKKAKKEVEIIEYYDLPYRYNTTVVKLLAQTPNSLFVYFEISDDDKKEFIIKYGENFFNDTKPVLLIHNKTMNYTFEVEINDFANCWYFHINDANCVYHIELGRKYVNYKPSYLNSDYICISSSNKMDAPNDHILFNTINNSVYFKNVKTNQVEERKISSFSSIKNIGKIYNIYDLYKQIYLEEDMQNFDLKNPSSTCPSSSFKI